MSTLIADGPKQAVIYPDRDGKRLAENTKQGRWISMLYGNLSALFAQRGDVFVAIDNLWYPVEGESTCCMAPDVYVVFGRPKGDRGSYKQWEENDVPLTVVFEILSPGNDPFEMIDKMAFYDEYGVEEYYLYDPESNKLAIYQRGQQTLRRIRDVGRFVSPRLGIRFEMTTPEMTVHGPDGSRFLPFEEIQAERIRQTQIADEEKRRADEEKRRADEEKRRADNAEKVSH